MDNDPQQYKPGQSMEFELPEVGVRALDFIHEIEEREKKDKKKKRTRTDDQDTLPKHLEEFIPEIETEDDEIDGEIEILDEASQALLENYSEPEVEPPASSATSVNEMLDILNRQAAKTHEQTPWRPQIASSPKKAADTPGAPPGTGEKQQIRTGQTEQKVKPVSLIKTPSSPQGEKPPTDTSDKTPPAPGKPSADASSATRITPSGNKAEIDPRQMAKNTAQLLAAQAAKTPEGTPDSPTAAVAGTPVSLPDDHAARSRAKKTAEMLAQQLGGAPISEDSLLYYAPKAPPVQKKKETSAEQKRKSSTLEKIPEEFRDLIDFLEESIDQYERYIQNIGRNGLAAANLGYYRDDIQDVLDMLKYEEKMDLRPYWERIVKLDLQLRAKASLYVREVGHNNFKQYQIINDPPQINWWWYLNRNVLPPMTQEPKFWEFWKKI